MLKTLHIKNYALIDDLNADFERGLNIITGETGAGKSIIIDALSLIIGSRADTSTVRKGSEKAIVEGIFDVSDNLKLKKLLSENQVDFNEELILRREVSVKGQSRSFINDTPSTTALLKHVGDLIVDLHGQHEHQSLLHCETHIKLLDDYGRLEGLVSEYSEAYRNALIILNELGELRAREEQLMEKMALYEFQIKEIDEVSPHAGEESELESELTILENAESLFSATEKLYQMLYESDAAVYDKLVLARNELEDLGNIDKSFEEAKCEIQSAVAIIDELAKYVQQYNSKIEFNPERLEGIRNRLGAIAPLKKKYGGSLDAVIRHREKIGSEFELASNFQNEIASLQKKLGQARSVASEAAQRLSSKRHDVAKKVNRQVAQALQELGITNAVFETSIKAQPTLQKEDAVVRFGKEWLEATSDGVDIVEFFISTNIGEEPKPLAKVASGGEISRIMLAMKMTLAKTDRLPLLIFDEIDVGVSGRIAQTVGQCLKKLSQFHQIIAITHLPQIAGLADAHHVVEKNENKKRAVTEIRKLNIEERVDEVAKLMSGAEITESGKDSARELMGMK